jgi:hypothetical protein
MNDAYMYRVQCLTIIRHGKKERKKERKNERKKKVSQSHVRLESAGIVYDLDRREHRPHD